MCCTAWIVLAFLLSVTTHSYSFHISSRTSRLGMAKELPINSFLVRSWHIFYVSVLVNCCHTAGDLVYILLLWCISIFVQEKSFLTKFIYVLCLQLQVTIAASQFYFQEVVRLDRLLTALLSTDLVSCSVLCTLCLKSILFWLFRITPVNYDSKFYIFGILS